MLNQVQSADFDIQIKELLLVHKNSFVHRFRWNEYRTGRMIDGMSFCVSGRAIFDCGDRKFELSAGQAVFLPASSSYIVRCESLEPFVHYTMNFTLEQSDMTEQTAFSEIICGHLRHTTLPENAELYASRFAELLSVWQGKKSGYRVMAKARAYELLYLYFTDAGRTHRNKDEYNRLLPAKRLLDESFTDTQSIYELAELCKMSETSFRRSFTRAFAMSPTEYRMNKRMLRAKDLLLSGQYSIGEIAAEVGFSDPNYFARVFRTREGVSPSEFMREA